MESSDNHDRIVLVLNGHHFGSQNHVKAVDFLLGSAKNGATDVDVKNAIEWMNENPSKVFFILDDIDKISYRNSETPCGCTSVHDVCTPGNILKRILDGMLFSGCTLISSCNSQNFETFEQANAINTDKCLTIQGLSQSAVTKLAKDYLGDKSFAVFGATSAYLSSLCENPTVLLLTLIAIKEGTGRATRIKGRAGIFLGLVEALVKKNMVTIEKLNKYKFACYVAKKSGRRGFNVRHLKNSSLSMEDMEKLQLDSYSLVKSYGFDNEVTFYFRHSLLLDGFAAFHIYDLDKTTLESEYAEIFDDVRYIRIWQLLGGFVSDGQNINLLSNLSSRDSSRKAQFAKDGKHNSQLISSYNNAAIVRTLEEAAEISDQLETLHLIAECERTASDIVVEELERFKLISYGSVQLNRSDACALAICICLRGNMTDLRLTNCLLSSTFVDVMYEQMSTYNEGNAKIDNAALNLENDNRIASTDETRSLSRFLEHVSKFCDFSGWNFEDEDLFILQQALNKIKNPKLQVQLENGDIMTAQSNWKDVIEQEVPPNGGSVTLNNCGLQFHQGTLENKSMVTLEMRNFTLVNPDEYIPVTPSMHVEIRDPLRKSVTVMLQPWCSEEDDDSSITVEIFRLPDDSDTWHTFTTVSLTEKMKFECQAFSNVRGFIKAKSAKRPPVFRVTGQIMANKKNTWCIVFHLNHKSTKKEVKDEMQGYNYRSIHFPFNTIYMKIGNILVADISIQEPLSLSFEGSKKISPRFRLTRRFLRNESYQLSKSYQLKCVHTRRKFSCCMEVNYKVLLDGNSTENNEGTFDYDVNFDDAVEESESLERIEDVFDNEIIPRFANGGEFAKFARSKNGFCLSFADQTNITENNLKRDEQNLQMLRLWMSRKLDMATPTMLRRLVDKYFATNPLAMGDEKRLLQQTFEEISDRFSDFHQWQEFAKSSYGLSLPEDYVNSETKGQDNITREQKTTMLKKWVDQTGDGACASALRDAADSFSENGRKIP